MRPQIQARAQGFDGRTVAVFIFVSTILAFTGGGAIMMVANARISSPADQADCRRDRGVPVRGVDGTVVCIASASVIWEAGRR